MISKFLTMYCLKEYLQVVDSINGNVDGSKEPIKWTGLPKTQIYDLSLYKEIQPEPI